MNSDFVAFPNTAPRLLPPPAAPPKQRGRLIFQTPDLIPQPLGKRKRFHAAPVVLKFEMVQIDLTAPIPAEGVSLIEDAADAASVIHWPIENSLREIQADADCDEFSRRRFRQMAAAVRIDYRVFRGMRTVTLLLKPWVWRAVGQIADHFGTDPQAVLRAALMVGIDSKLDQRRAKAGR
jgi:hypothetical protein